MSPSTDSRHRVTSMSSAKVLLQHWWPSTRFMAASSTADWSQSDTSRAKSTIRCFRALRLWRLGRRQMLWRLLVARSYVNVKDSVIQSYVLYIEVYNITSGIRYQFYLRYCGSLPSGWTVPVIIEVSLNVLGSHEDDEYIVIGFFSLQAYFIFFSDVCYLWPVVCFSLLKFSTPGLSYIGQFFIKREIRF